MTTTTCTYSAPRWVSDGGLKNINTAPNGASFSFRESVCTSEADFPLIENGFTHGEVLTNFLLITIIVLIMLGGFLNIIFGVKIKRKI